MVAMDGRSFVLKAVFSKTHVDIGWVLPPPCNSPYSGLYLRAMYNYLKKYATVTQRGGVPKIQAPTLNSKTV